MPQGKGTYGTKRGRPPKKKATTTRVARKVEGKRTTDADRKRYRKLMGGVLSKFEGSRVTDADIRRASMVGAAKKKATVKKTTTKGRVTDTDIRRKLKMSEGSRITDADLRRRKKRRKK